MAEANVMNALVPVEKLNPVELFKPEGLTPILEKIKEEVKKHVPDASTEEGRKQIKSLARKVASSKVTMDDLGKNLVQSEKERLKVIDSERKRMRDELDALKAEVLQPVEEWQKKEQERVEAINQKIKAIALLQVTSHPNGEPLTAEELKESLKKVEAIEITKEEYQECMEEAVITHRGVVATLRKFIPEREQYEADQAELQKLREEREKREKEEAEKKAQEEQKALEERLKKQAEEKAKREAEERIAEEKRKAEEEAEAKIEAEREKVRKAEEEAEAKVQAERDRVAKEKAEREAEKQRKAEEAQRIKEEEERRKADEENQRKTHASIMLHFWSFFPEYAQHPKKQQLEKYVDALAKGECPELEVKY